MTSFFPTDAIRSRLEWNATLNPAAAPQTTEATKYHRKVSILSTLDQCCSSPDLLLRRLSLRLSVSLGKLSICPMWPLSCIRTGPKVNTVEKLAELRRAGVNIGESI
jgi:pyruvate kinase